MVVVSDWDNLESTVDLLQSLKGLLAAPAIRQQVELAEDSEELFRRIDNECASIWEMYMYIGVKEEEINPYLTELTPENLKQITEANSDIKLMCVRSLSDVAAKSLGRHKGSLWLDELNSLSDAAAGNLVKHEGSLYLDLDALPESAAEILRQHPSYRDDE